MKKLILLLFIIITTFLLQACGKSITNPDDTFCIAGKNEGIYICEKKYTSFFDTIISLKIYYDESSDYEVNKIFEDFENLSEKYHQYFDKYNAYDNLNNLYTINNTDGPVVVDEELFDAILYAKENEDLVTIDSTSLFNIALHPVLMVWHNARNSSACDPFINIGVDYCPVPTSEIEGHTFNTNPNDIILDKTNHSIDFKKEDMGIDLGGFAKGYFNEIAIEYLNTYNINYILNLGNSNVHAHGVNLDRTDGLFYIGLSTPFSLNPNDYYAIVKLSNGLNLVSSGNYQRYFKNVDDLEDETLYHHIIDPRTYYPGGEATSITILYNNGAIGDILSTTLYLMTVEEGLEYVNNFPGLEALWYIDEDNIVMSENFKDYIME
ncbi:MAG: FAD:protein FMN transferase [Candidatus Izemoplasmatales bacterium]